MGSDTAGKAIVVAKLENLSDLVLVRQGLKTPDQVRSLEVADALIDTGATGLFVPSRLIAQLGLESSRQRQARMLAGDRAVRLTIQGRDCISDVAEIPDDHSLIVGQVPLELMDWVVDPKGQRLIGNPEHGGEEMIDVL
jgi:predicted aspartyl protease